MNSGMDTDSYRALMRHQAGAVTVIAAGGAGYRSGITATAFSSLSDDPPAILACVSLKSSVHAVIRETGAFSVNILANDQQHVAEQFSGKTGLKGEDRFTGSSWSVLTTGAPVLQGALASLDCQLSDQHGFSTHSIFIGMVQGGRFRAEAQPLLYFRNDYWDLGPR
jgi:flavin reductase (DIM6/NTAB) family NADH-FMN oxidoreductase RutF